MNKVGFYHFLARACVILMAENRKDIKKRHENHGVGIIADKLVFDNLCL